MVDNAEQLKSTKFKSGFIALIGRPNAGKSSLINKLVEKKIAITSQNVQTTRQIVRAILTTDNYQLVFVDTPGIHKPHDVLGDELNKIALQTADDVDIVIVAFDASKQIGTGDKFVTSKILNCYCKKICVLTKCDLLEENRISNQLVEVNKLHNWDATIAVSAKSGLNIDRLISTTVSFLPEGPMWFPRNMTTDQATSVLISEIIREKALEVLRDEVPYSIGVQLDEQSYDKSKNLNVIYASIYVERKSQRGIVVGKNGSLIKRIGSEARIDLENILGSRIFLDLKVKIKKNWRSDINQVHRFGYGNIN